MSPRAVSHYALRHHAKLCATILLSASAVLAGCTIPLQRSASDSSAAGSTGGAGTSTDTQGQCASLRDEIKTNQNKLRQAPTTSINEDIVAAAQGHAAKRIDDLQAQYDALGCSATQLPPSHGRFAPLPAAPGGKQQ